AVDVSRPQPAKGRLQRTQRSAGRARQAAGADSALMNQARLLEHAQVLRDGGPADVESARDVARRPLFAPDQPQDLTAPRVRQRKQGVAWSGSDGGLCNHAQYLKMQLN